MKVVKYFVFFALISILCMGCDKKKVSADNELTQTKDYNLGKIEGNSEGIKSTEQQSTAEQVTESTEEIVSIAPTEAETSPSGGDIALVNNVDTSQEKQEKIITEAPLQDIPTISEIPAIPEIPTIPEIETTNGDITTEKDHSEFCNRWYSDYSNKLNSKRIMLINEFNLELSNNQNGTFDYETSFYNKFESLTAVFEEAILELSTYMSECSGTYSEYEQWAYKLSEVFLSDTNIILEEYLKYVE